MCFRRPITCYLDSKQLMMWVSNQLFSKCLCGNLNHSHVIVWKLIYQRVKWNSILMFLWDLISWNIFSYNLVRLYNSNMNNSQTFHSWNLSEINYYPFHLFIWNANKWQWMLCIIQHWWINIMEIKEIGYFAL